MEDIPASPEPHFSADSQLPPHPASYRSRLTLRAKTRQSEEIETLLCECLKRIATIFYFKLKKQFNQRNSTRHRENRENIGGQNASVFSMRTGAKHGPRNVSTILRHPRGEIKVPP
ncbi:MAG TPA: hypothetical protein PK250_05455, partial [Syntrophobacter fumaroxidans]|nr:hypothetical protein [Syntrophobacter fumaroxidans]